MSSTVADDLAVTANRISGAAPSIADIAAAKSMAPLWTVYKDLMSHEPQPTCRPAHWRYTDIRPLLSRAGREVSTSEAERRVLLFKNPGLDQPVTTHTLGCGMQLLLEGEQEGAHRHTPAALRFVVEGDGAYTTTDGERIWMTPGDLITTPSWTWHDHGKVTAGEMIWLDGIDVPLVNHLGLNFTEYAEGERRQVLAVADGESRWLYGSGLAPLKPIRAGAHSPVYIYPYSVAREALDRLRAGGRVDDAFGVKLRYSDPQTGGHIMPTLAAFLQLLPAGFETTPYRSTDAAIFCVAEGRGRVRIGTEQYDLAPHDVFVVPNWTDYTFHADSEMVVFSYSDRAMQERLSLFRECHGDAGAV